MQPDTFYLAGYGYTSSLVVNYINLETETTGRKLVCLAQSRHIYVRSFIRNASTLVCDRFLLLRRSRFISFRPFYNPVPL